ncbi:MAG: hypothetical protein KDJ73_14895 [Notoacmeibacter sp.]|nr:hypothetical protein [Notoacmeibacter sp.]MCC0032474.1 hypothetical protein [Brucellaceae bacterium]
MFGFIFRLFSLALLALACILAVLDASRSVAAGETILTPLGKSWFELSPDTLNLAQATIQRHVAAFLWDPVILALLKLPGFAVFGFLALLFYMIGYRRRRRIAGRFLVSE